MNNRYQRNRIYIANELQEAIKSAPVLIAGAGIGSIIAECALRLGFETMTVIDGDFVEESNLNRQNYIYNDIQSPKVHALGTRLKEINPEANIKLYNQYLNHYNVYDIISGHSIAINALDFTTDLPLVFDDICQKNNTHVIHPYNLGFAGAAAVISPSGENLRSINKTTHKTSEIDFVQHILANLKHADTQWLKDVLNTYINENEKKSPPQLSIGSLILSGITVSLMIKILKKDSIKYFPEFYYKESF